ncbi:MAG: type II toxin-antitoxin system PemK/MazF family toxin [Leptolyngbya sp. SIO4C1]|nr:type II toxin-antitoxin system PemK/MazF family toxin [Leptolyngbya sp. SIO4C1]
MSAVYPRQGEVYLVKALKSIGDTKKRPVVIISMNIRNELSNTAIAVPFTSNLRDNKSPTRILIPAGEGGLDADSLAVCDSILAVRKSYLERGPYGMLSAESISRIQTGIQIAIGIY